MKVKKSDITSEEIHAWFECDDATGQLYWKSTNEPAGHIGRKGRRFVSMFGLHIPATHIIWMLMYDRWPASGMVIHHRNTNPADDRIENLEEITKEEDDLNRRYGNKWIFLT